VNKYVKVALVVAAVVLVLRYRNQIATMVAGVPVVGKLVIG
jgi:hypothetical protein